MYRQNPAVFYDVEKGEFVPGKPVDSELSKKRKIALVKEWYVSGKITDAELEPLLEAALTGGNIWR